MTEIEILSHALKAFAGIDEENFKLSEHHWQLKEYRKDEFYNEYKNVCKHLGFIINGVFRSYYVDGESGEEKNVFFFSQHQIVTAYKSMVDQTPCNYYTQAMVPSKILYIHIDQLHALYGQSHQWERLGRLMAEKAFNMAMSRAEAFMFQSPEQRYLELVEHHPDIFNAIPLYHISSYLGIQGPSLSRIRKRLSGK